MILGFLESRSMVSFVYSKQTIASWVSLMIGQFSSSTDSNLARMEWS